MPTASTTNAMCYHQRMGFRKALDECSNAAILGTATHCLFLRQSSPSLKIDLVGVVSYATWNGISGPPTIPRHSLGSGRGLLGIYRASGNNVYFRQQVGQHGVDVQYRSQICVPRFVISVSIVLTCNTAVRNCGPRFVTRSFYRRGRLATRTQ